MCSNRTYRTIRLRPAASRGNPNIRNCWIAVAAFIGLVALATGCAHRQPAPYVGLDGQPVRPTPTLEPYVKDGARVEGLYIIDEKPPELLVNQRSPDNKMRLTVWRMRDSDLPNGEVFFRSLVFCDMGVPRPGEPKQRCGQYYFGVKVDGSETLALQKSRPAAWVIVLTPQEQSALRINEVCGEPNPYDMAGC